MSRLNRVDTTSYERAERNLLEDPTGSAAYSVEEAQVWAILAVAEAIHELTAEIYAHREDTER